MKGLLFQPKIALVLALALPLCAVAEEGDYTSKLTNKSKENGGTGYTLVQDRTWGEPTCVVDTGSKELKPGDSTNLSIKKGCKWGGVQYKIMKEGDNSDVGRLSHSFRDGTFTIEITSECQNTGCDFYDLNPQQVRENKPQ